MTNSTPAPAPAPKTGMPMWLIILLVLLLLIVLGCCGGLATCYYAASFSSSSPTPAELKLDGSDAFKTFHLADKQPMRIVLTSNGSVGYGWGFKRIDGDSLTPDGTEDLTRGTPAPGSSSTTAYKFRALKPGQSIITMDYTHREGADFFTNERTFTIIVDKAP